MADIQTIHIARDEDGHFTITAGGRIAVGFGYDEMLGAIARMTLPDDPVLPASMFGVGSRLAPADAPGTVTLRLLPDEAERMSCGAADLLCWARGFIAGRPDDLNAHPLGVEDVRDLRIRLKRAIAEAGDRDFAEVSF